jgi:hypothetical protein
MKAPLFFRAPRSSFLLAGVVLGVSCSPPPPKVDTRSPDPVTQQKATPSGGKVSLSWKKPTDFDYATTMVVRYLAAFDGKPDKGATYAEGDTLGSGTVVYVGAKSAFEDTTVPTGCVGFGYQFFVNDSAGNWSVGVDITLRSGAASFPPTASPTEASATRDATHITVNWTNPAATTGWTSIEVRRTQGAQAASVSAGVSAYSGTGVTLSEPLSLAGTGELFYTVFSCNNCGICAPVPAVSSVTVAAPNDGGSDGGLDGGTCGGGVPAQPCDLTAVVSASGRHVTLSWTSPAVSPDFNRVKVLRALGAPPSGPDDATATVIFDGLAPSAEDLVTALTPTAPASSCPGVSFPQTPQVIYHYAVYGCLNAACETVGSSTSFVLQVSQALRAGGYTLFWRHATANVCMDDTTLGTAAMTSSPDWWKSCESDCQIATARQTDGVASVNETSNISGHFAAQKFTVGRVLSSEFCRCMQTAQGFGFGPTIEASVDLTYFVYAEAQRCAKSLALLNEAPIAGTNTAMVSHAGFTGACAPLDALAWSEAAIFRPVADGGTPLYITRVPWNGWACLP